MSNPIVTPMDVVIVADRTVTSFSTNVASRREGLGILNHTGSVAYVGYAKAASMLETSTDIAEAAANLEWNVSASGTNEYYLSTAAAADPTAVMLALGAYIDPDWIEEDDAAYALGTVGSLLVSEFAFGDNDTLGYSTIYIRLSSGAAHVDPANAANSAMTLEHINVTNKMMKHVDSEKWVWDRNLIPVETAWAWQRSGATVLLQKLEAGE